MKSILMFMSTLLLGSCIGQGGGSATSSVRVVKGAMVREYSALSRVVEYPAKIGAATDVNLSFRVAGVIDRVAVDEGVAVRKGEPLVYMDRRDYELQLAATQAEYDGVRGEVERLVAMYEDRSISENDYDKAQVALRRITAKLSADRNALSDATLLAPFDGYMGQRYFDQGEAVAAGMPVVSFVSSQAPELVVNLPAAEYLRRADLLSASASVKLFPEVKFPLRLISFSPTANLNQLYAARFEVEAVDGVLPPAGVSAMVSISFDVESAEQFVIPFASVVERDGQSYVWVVEEGVVALREVTVLSIRGDGSAVVEGGVESGDEVVAAGVSYLKAGDRVVVNL